jgi:hypothetical protein
LSEALLLSRMHQECKGRQCPHWKKFCEYFFEAGLHWHNFIVINVDDPYPTFRMSTPEERMDLKPRTHFGAAARRTVETLALLSLRAAASGEKL